MRQKINSCQSMCARVRTHHQRPPSECGRNKPEKGSNDDFSANFDIKNCKNERIHQKDANFDINISLMISIYQKLHLRQKFYPFNNDSFISKAKRSPISSSFALLFANLLEKVSRKCVHIALYDFRNVTQVTLGGRR